MLIDLIIPKAATVGGIQATWTNKYRLQTTDLGTAQTLAAAIMAMETAITKDVVTIGPYRLDEVAGDGQVATGPAANFGGVTAGAPLIPLWNVVRVVFYDTAGRPEQKYLRLPLAEDEQDDGVLTEALTDLVQTEYADPLSGELEYVGPNAEAHSGAFRVVPLVQMRQLHRKRASRPGFHRGWIAD